MVDFHTINAKFVDDIVGAECACGCGEPAYLPPLQIPLDLWFGTYHGKVFEAGIHIPVTKCCNAIVSIECMNCGDNEPRACKFCNVPIKVCAIHHSYRGPFCETSPSKTGFRSYQRFVYDLSDVEEILKEFNIPMSLFFRFVKNRTKESFPSIESWEELKVTDSRFPDFVKAYMQYQRIGMFTCFASVPSSVLFQSGIIFLRPKVTNWTMKQQRRLARKFFKTFHPNHAPMTISKKERRVCLYGFTTILVRRMALDWRMICSILRRVLSRTT